VIDTIADIVLDSMDAILGYLIPRIIRIHRWVACRCKHDWKYIGDAHIESTMFGGPAIIDEIYLCKRCQNKKTVERSDRCASPGN
jgi:hypothetical protein